MYHLTHIQKPTRPYTLFIPHPSLESAFTPSSTTTDPSGRTFAVYTESSPSWQPHLLRIARARSQKGWDELQDFLFQSHIVSLDPGWKHLSRYCLYRIMVLVINETWRVV